jgi:uncharacterized protein YbaR (Trm112 family)
MLVISDTRTCVRLACPACGAEQTLARFTSRREDGRERSEPDEGQWLPCPVCQEWSPVEQREVAAAH